MSSESSTPIDEDHRPPAVRRPAPPRHRAGRGGGRVPDQIIVWISIDDVLRPLPAILDTGHGHNLSIEEGQLQRWSGASLKRIGELEIGHRRVVQYTADVRVHRNVPGRAALRGDSYPLEMPQGISGSRVASPKEFRLAAVLSRSTTSLFFSV
jgi:hypothetical protein